MPSAPGFADLWIRALDSVWRIPGQPASVWLEALFGDTEHLSGIFPGLIDDADTYDMYNLAWSEGFDARCERAARKALERAAGRDWVWAWNLMKLSAAGRPWINGRLVRQGVVASQVSLPDWLDAAYTLIYEAKDEAGRAALEQDMMIPPAGVQVQVSREAQRRAALAFAAD